MGLQTRKNGIPRWVPWRRRPTSRELSVRMRNKPSFREVSLRQAPVQGPRANSQVTRNDYVPPLVEWEGSTKTERSPISDATLMGWMFAITASHESSARVAWAWS